METGLWAQDIHAHVCNSKDRARGRVAENAATRQNPAAAKIVVFFIAGHSKLSAMKRLWLIPPLAAAAMAAGCGSRPQPPQGQGQGAGWQTCTDQQGHVVDDRQCEASSPGYRPGLFRWY